MGIEVIYPYLNGFRGFIDLVSNKLTDYTSLAATNISLILTIAISLYFSRVILNGFYDSLEERNTTWLVLSAIIFYVIKFVGVA